MWCHVQEGYLYLVHKQFKDILNKYLLVDKLDPACFQLEWPLHHQRPSTMNPDNKIKNYLNQYSRLENIWTSNKPGQDIIDMLKIDKDSTTGKNVVFAYFLPGPNCKTSIKCSHAAESIMQIGMVNMGRNVAGSEHVRSDLIIVDTFLDMLTKAKFILAIGRSETSSGNDVPSLEEEKKNSCQLKLRLQTS